MALNLYQLATMGLGPGRTVSSDVSFGFFGLQVSVVVTPYLPGGVAVYPNTGTKQITIYINYRDKSWRRSYFYNSNVLGVKAFLSFLKESKRLLLPRLVTGISGNTIKIVGKLISAKNSKIEVKAKFRE